MKLCSIPWCRMQLVYTCQLPWWLDTGQSSETSFLLGRINCIGLFVNSSWYFIHERFLVYQHFPPPLGNGEKKQTKRKEEKNKSILAKPEQKEKQIFPTVVKYMNTKWSHKQFSLLQKCMYTLTSALIQ